MAQRKGNKDGSQETVEETFRKKNAKSSGLVSKPAPQKITSITKLFASELKKNKQVMSQNSNKNGKTDVAKIEKVNFNAYNDNDESTDEEALEAAICIEAKKMRPKMKNTNLDRNQITDNKSESESTTTPRVRRLFNLKSLQHQDEIRRNKKKDPVEQLPSRKDFYEHLNKARYRRQQLHQKFGIKSNEFSRIKAS